MYRKLVCLPWVSAIGLCFALSATSAPDEAATDNAGPAEVVSGVTAEVMSVVAQANTYFDSDPERYSRHIPIIDLAFEENNNSRQSASEDM